MLIYNNIIPGGEQLISLVQGCIDDPVGTVGHEVMHALGYVILSQILLIRTIFRAEHEHQRPDRDQYIDVEPSWANRSKFLKIGYF
jgi:hypothetical protein